MTDFLDVGLYSDVPHDEYHADPAELPSLSSGTARVLVEESPLHAWAGHPRLGNIPHERESKELDRGTIVHALMLGKGGEFEVIEADNFRTKAAQEQRDAARDAGKVPVLARELRAYEALARMFTAKLLATVDADDKPDPVDLAGGESELTGIWREPDGSLCRLRLDNFASKTLQIVDLKTTGGSASPRMIANALAKYGADIQAAHYTRGIEQLVPGSEGRVRFRFAYLEMREPHDVVVAELDGAFLEMGRRRWRRAQRLWTRCMETGRWPGHSDGRTIRIAPPRWLVSDDLDADLAGMGPPSTPDF